jgi:hypothetical protein
MMVCLGMAGCAAISTAKQQDLLQASVIAEAIKDSAGQACWTLLASIPTPTVIGAATALELSRIPSSPAVQAACGGLAFGLGLGVLP